MLLLELAAFLALPLHEQVKAIEAIFGSFKLVLGLLSSSLLEGPSRGIAEVRKASWILIHEEVAIVDIWISA